MKRFSMIYIMPFLVAILLTSCDKDDSVIIETEYSVGAGSSGGLRTYISIYTGTLTNVEELVAFAPLKDCTIKKLEIKVARNSLSADSQLTLRKNNSDTELSINIPKEEKGYFIDDSMVLLDQEDEINLFLDTSGSLQSGNIQITIRVVLE